MSWLGRLATFTAIAFALAGCGRDGGLESPETRSAKGANLAPVAVAPAEVAPIEGARPNPAQAKKVGVEFERRVDDARRTVDVTIYGAAWCPSCKQARAWLDAQGMAYSERDIDRSEEANRTVHRLNPAGTIPVIDVEGEVIVGFAPEVMDRTIRRKAASKVN